MKIVLEGCDAVYKSTIAKKLSEELDMSVIHGSSFELSKCTNDVLYEHFLNLSKLDNVIYDRLIYSNKVYATLFDDYAILTDEQRNTVENIMREETVVIHLTADKDTIVSRLGERGDEYIGDKDISGILDGYDVAITEAVTSGMAVVTFDTSSLSSDEIVERIVEMVSHTTTYSDTNEI